MAEYLPMFTPGSAITYTAGTAIKGGQIVELSGDRTISPAGADSATVVGVAGNDTAEGDRVVVYSGGVQRPTAADAINAGDPVCAAADGKASATGTHRLGIAIEAAKADEPVPTKFDA